MHGDAFLPLDMKSTLSHILKTAAYTTAACALSLTLGVGSTMAAPNATAAADFLKQYGIVSGDAQTGELRLDDQINRAELMKILVNAAADTVDPFSFRDCLADINSEWFARYVCWSYENNYVQGYPDGGFHAGRSVNHAEAIKMISEVFHLDYQRMAPVADDTLWYDIYMRNAQRQGLIDAPLSSEDLARPATRGEVFDYLFRAMAVSDGYGDTFSEDGYGSYPAAYALEQANASGARERELTAAEKALLAVMRSQVDYGFQPMSGTGSTMVKFGGSGMGMSFDVRADVTTDAKYDGTKDALEGFNEDVQLVLDVTSDGDDTVGFKATADIELAGSGMTMLYAKLDNLEMVDVVAPIEAKLALNQAMEEVNQMKGIWYSIDLTSLEEGVPLENSMDMYKAVSLAAIDFIEKSLKQGTEPYFDIIQSDEGQRATILVKPNPDRINAMVENIVLGMQPSTNRYLVRQTTRTFDSALNMFANNMSMLLTYDKLDLLVRKFAAVMDAVTVEIPEERTKLTFEFASEEYYNYDKDFEIVLPTGAIDIQEFWSGGAAPERPEEVPEEMIETEGEEASTGTEMMEQ